MAYNREWDRGRDPWQDNNSWNDYGGGKGHRREEDHHGEGKRRKFNDGVGVFPQVESDARKLIFS